MRAWQARQQHGISARLTDLRTFQVADIAPFWPAPPDAHTITNQNHAQTIVVFVLTWFLCGILLKKT